MKSNVTTESASSPPNIVIEKYKEGDKGRYKITCYHPITEQMINGKLFQNGNFVANTNQFFTISTPSCVKKSKKIIECDYEINPPCKKKIIKCYECKPSPDMELRVTNFDSKILDMSVTDCNDE